ncbi:2-C-methyl-D-erythritol 4-phosphate cytidylyltransferase [Corynebacterium timonense]|uniref:2-C-methyl-D-erythritol 4-phosphate cytidylyltransferase n=1 Tax=Corynebacterium timonense TaxID=441500 RepID=A0A1H1L6Y9_9CORY|nr:2-C-methyl-D-erythritol 4-phosphate cytidylyltransferase [Corynebacterium timonense]SDR70266.1 2-C-methyl-D-erythritol 4-phosphate cytidylyltransferase [Corynebacterium timonense]
MRAVTAIVAAAGRGTRLGAELPKAFVELGGITLLERSVAALEASGVVDDTIVVVSPDMEDTARRVLAGRGVSFVHGGAERADSMYNGLRAIDAEDGVVLIHDAARCLTPPGMIARVAGAVVGGEVAAVPVVAVADTIKEVDAAGAVVVSTPSRARLRAVQTPQAFDLRELRRANEAYFSERPEFVATDDASLMEWFGARVATVEGDALAFKITTPLDMRLAQALIHVR